MLGGEKGRDGGGRQVWRSSNVATSRGAVATWMNGKLENIDRN